MPPQPTDASTAYTTIPISGVSAVVSRSFHNLSAALSRRRPWPEFLSSLKPPPSLADASLRIRRNSAYFSANYAVLVVFCSAASLIGYPVALILLGLVFFLWLILFFFREDPLIVMGHHVSDWVVVLGLVVVSIWALWITGPLNSFSIGIMIGLLLWVAHGVMRDTEGIFLDENDAVSSGLLVSGDGVARDGLNPPV